MKHTPKGFILAAVLVVLGVMLFLSGAALSVSQLESRISRSQSNGGVAQQKAAGCMQLAFSQLDTDTGVGGWRQYFQGSFAALRADPASSSVYEVSTTYLGGACTVRVCTTGTVASPSNTCSVAGLPNGIVLVSALATSSENNTTSRRRVVARVQLNDPVAPYAGIGLYGGTNLSFQGSGPTDTVKSFTGADVQAAGITITGNSRISIPGDTLQSSGAITGTSSRATIGSYSATNYPPAAPVPTVYTYPFADAATNALRTMTAAEFQCLFASTSNIPNSSCPSWTHSIRGAGCNTTQTVTLPSGIYYITNSLAMNTSCYRRSTLNLTGSLVINGTFTVAGAGANGVTINVTAAGDNTGGIMSSGAMTIGTAATLTIDGMIYSGGDLNFSNGSSISLTGGIFAPAGNVYFSPTATATVVYDATNITSNFGSSSTYYPPAQQQYWEDEY
jgi:hypothetical protein